MYLNTELLKKKQFKDRYDLQKFLPYNNNVYDLIDSWFLNRIRKLPIAGMYQVHGEEMRPELISYNIYGTVGLCHILMMYNDIISFTEIEAGSILTYPSIEDIEQVYFQLNAREKAHFQGIVSK